MSALDQFTTRPVLRGTFGMVSSTHWLASAAGMRVLERGGNAFDAAVAAGLTLQVVEPHQNGPGGDLPVVFWSEREQRVHVLCGQGVAPAAATIERFAQLGLESVPGTGLLAACVPGAFDAWMKLLRDHGTLRLADVLDVAIGFADQGFPVIAPLSETIASMESFFAEHWPSSAATYLAGGVPAPGTLLRNRALAETYRRIVAQATRASAVRESQIDAARDCFYRGFVAEAIERYLSSAAVLDSSGRPHAGLLSGQDLATWKAGYESPVTFDYGEFTLCKTGPWGQGPVMLQQLALLAGYNLPAMGQNSAAYVHTVIECAKLALADREAWYGDPEHFDVPLQTLLSSGYAAQRRTLVGRTASMELAPGSPDGRAPCLPRQAGRATAAVGVGMSAGDPTRQAGDGVGAGDPTRQAGDTCQLNVADRHGNLVAATPSGGWLQSSPIIPELGFALGTRAQMFWLEPGLASSLAPGRRPRTTLTPSLALRDGAPYLAFGTPGGDQQDQWSLTFLLAHLHFARNLQAAIDSPRFHTLHANSSFYPRAADPGRIEVEQRLAPEVIAELLDRGHRVTVGKPWTYGRVSAVARERKGVLSGAADARGMQCYTIGR
jgi:gamma-glutamyltranspeptidase / glutathione hydrolase